ncbi:TRAP transporter small permease [Paracoccus sp. (in: a-proteobacteria)]|uniref:TRAP transporter small permease n=1 Tax=Paracoccus sp. TaxID=267 RepID=UPI003A8AB58A
MPNDRFTATDDDPRTTGRAYFTETCNLLAQILAITSMGLVFVYVLMICANVVMRYFLNAPMGWVSDMGAIFVPLAMAPCLAVAAARGMLVVVSMVGEKLPLPLRRFFVLLAHTGTAVVLAVIAWQVFGYAMDTFHEGRSTMLVGIPTAPVWFAVAASFALAVPLSLAPQIMRDPEV